MHFGKNLSNEEGNKGFEIGSLLDREMVVSQDVFLCIPGIIRRSQFHSSAGCCWDAVAEQPMFPHFGAKQFQCQLQTSSDSFADSVRGNLGEQLSTILDYPQHVQRWVVNVVKTIPTHVIEFTTPRCDLDFRTHFPNHGSISRWNSDSKSFSHIGAMSSSPKAGDCLCLEQNLSCARQSMWRIDRN